MENKLIKYDLRQGLLTIFETTYNDHGTYICYASNEKGNASAAIVVNVKSKYVFTICYSTFAAHLVPSLLKPSTKLGRGEEFIVKLCSFIVLVD